MENLKIYTANTRLAKYWKLNETTWDNLVERLKTPMRTPETIAEYKNMNKSEQGKIKDVGGFVGGVLDGGRRLNRNAGKRYIVTLDADFCGADFPDKVQEKLAGDYIIYSTHSHYEGHERYRLVVKISRPVTPDEYQPLARKIAESVGIEYFDDSTYEPARLMYWPSAAMDGNYFFEEASYIGALDVDTILRRYDNWQDASSWPTSTRSGKLRDKLITKNQQDPTEKKGVIGAFCRALTIEEVIDKYLPDIYTKSDAPNRYTYINGTTANGLVVYDNKYAYSNHSTDPAGDKLCNAFDLVRLHKFGELDDEAEADTPVNRLPSFTAVDKFLRDEECVKHELTASFFKEMQSAFAEDPEDTESSAEEDLSWRKKLTPDRTGKPEQSVTNCVIVMENDPRLKGLVVQDDFDGQLKFTRKAPWRDIKDYKYWRDADSSALKMYLESYGLTTASKINEAFNIWAQNNTQHPVREYLNSLKWDGVQRVETLFIDFLGATDDEYTRVVTKKALTAAVTRIYRPGAKFDNMLVLIGEQGKGKSTILKKLGMKWHSDSLTKVQDKDALEQLQGAWIVEMGELTAMRRSEVEAVKQFLSKTDDRFRPAYGHYLTTRERQCIFIGTTNDRAFLRDTTGNRRFWAIDTDAGTPTKSVFTYLDAYEVGQVWAEAVEYYKAKEPLYLPAELEAEAAEKRKEHIEDSQYTGIVRRYLDMWVPADWRKMDTVSRKIYYNSYNSDVEGQLGCFEPIDRVCAAAMWVEAIGGELKMLDKTKAREINDIVRNVPGWEQKAVIKFGDAYGNTRGFIREKVSKEGEQDANEC